MKKIVVIAWAEMTKMVEIPGVYERFDGYNLRPKRELEWEGKAAVYSSDPKEEEKAKEYIKTLTEFPVRAVFVLPDSDDVLVAARKRIVEMALTPNPLN